MRTTSRNFQKWAVLLTIIGFCCLPTLLSALIIVHEGNDPVGNMGWPIGTAAVANLDGRFEYKEGPPFGSGEYYFKYLCKNTAEFNDALQTFSAIRVPRLRSRSLVSLNGQQTGMMNPKPLLLVVHDRANDTSAKQDGEKKRADWTFTVWNPANYYRLFNNPKSTFTPDHPNFRQPVPAPRIDVYTDDEGPIFWEEVRVPSNVRVIDKRAAASTVDIKHGGAIGGAVFEMSTHQVIAGANVTLVKQNEDRRIEEVMRSKTDKDGTFEIRNIPHGYYRIRISADGYAERDMGFYNNLRQYTYEEYEALLAKTTSCEGMVKDETGKPIAGVEVTAHEMMGIDGLGYECPTEPSATTDEEGHFVLTSVPEGFIHIRCRASSLHQETSIFNLYQVSSQRWEKTETIDIVMSGTGLVRGKVVDAEGNPPKREYIAEIEPKGGNKIGNWGGSMKCKEDGSFEFKGVPLGEYNVIAKPNPMREGEALPPKPVTITAGKTVEIEFVIE
jgi:hypothetical protein